MEKNRRIRRQWKIVEASKMFGKGNDFILWNKWSCGKISENEATWNNNKKNSGEIFSYRNARWGTNGDNEVEWWIIFERIFYQNWTVVEEDNHEGKDFMGGILRSTITLLELRNFQANCRCLGRGGVDGGKHDQCQQF